MDELPNRKRIRLKNYDYSQNGYYFVTLCTHERQKLFETSVVGNDLCVVPSKSQPNQIIEKWLYETQNKYNVIIANYIIMPDHVHVILNICDKHNDACEERHTGRSLPEIMKWFKTMTTNAYIQYVKKGMLKPFDKKLWQKSYYEHVIRNETDYMQTVEYIVNNPLKRELENSANDIKHNDAYNKRNDTQVIPYDITIDDIIARICVYENNIKHNDAYNKRNDM